MMNTEDLSALSPVLMQARDQLEALESFVRRVENAEMDLRRHALKAKRETNARFTAVIGNVTQSRDEVNDEITEREEQARSQLNNAKASVSLPASTLTTLIQRAQSASGSDVTSAREELQAALLSEDLLCRVKRWSAPRDAWPRCTYDVGDVPAVPVGACMGKVVPSHADAISNPMSTEKTSFAAVVKEAVFTSLGFSTLVLLFVLLVWYISPIEKVAFHAMGKGHAATQLGQRIVFDDVYLNVAGGYNMTSGVFTAPVGGMYVLNAAVLTADRSGRSAASVIMHVPPHKFSEDKVLTVSRILQMGQQVWVELMAGKGGPFSWSFFGTLMYTV